MFDGNIIYEEIIIKRSDDFEEKRKDLIIDFRWNVFVLNEFFIF